MPLDSKAISNRITAIARGNYKVKEKQGAVGTYNKETENRERFLVQK